ncbi:hypothetical protein [Nitrospirillum viridazoti]|uniref:Uncharacterized protein n=1 Tax=Nitrospirillum amazonense TaxID=28077 RepID=A0A560HTV9_9PROT|nr:hypothetical protein [Nitrospirillum amazonense]TWB48959.1 hypothetical protein FBZ92_12761 [Nitrospirillum amazonense]
MPTIKQKITTCMAVTAAALLISPAALAFDIQGQAKVVMVEPSYMPGYVTFQIDTDIGPCKANTWLYWYAKGPDQTSQNANVAAAYSTFLTAASTGMTVILYGNSNNCSFDFLNIKRL